jgi:Sec-independent protein translocase protein TatA
MSRIILIMAVAILILFVFRLVKLLSKFGSGTRPNVDDLKDRATHLKNKYKDLEDAEFRDVTPPNEESEPSEKNNA